MTTLTIAMMETAIGWGENEPPKNALEDVLLKIDDVTAALTRSDLLARVDDVVVAYSPGFFPAEFWSAADAQLRLGMPTLYAS